MASIENVGSGNNAILSGTYTAHASLSVLSMGSDGEADTQFIFPTDHDWILIEVYNVEGVVGDLSRHRWTDKIPTDIISFLIAEQNIIDNNSNITTYTIEAMRYDHTTGKADTYKGDEVSDIALVHAQTEFTMPTGDWIITDEKITPTYVARFGVEFTVAEDSTVIFNVTGGNITTIRKDTKEVVSTTSSIPTTTGITYYTYTDDPISNFYFGPSWSNHRIKTINVISALDLTLCSNMFYPLDDLITLDIELTRFNTSNVTDFTKMFSYCINISTFPLVNTSNGTNFSEMFSHTESLSYPAIDTSNGTNFSNMFSYCWQHSRQATLPNIDTSSGTDFSYMFHNSPNFSNVPSVFNFLEATNMQSCFGRDNYGGIETVSANINPTGACNFKYLCNGNADITCLTSIDTTNATDTTDMFYGCSSLTAPDSTDQANIVSGANWTNSGSCP